MKFSGSLAVIVLVYVYIPVVHKELAVSDFLSETTMESKNGGIKKEVLTRALYCCPDQYGADEKRGLLVTQQQLVEFANLSNNLDNFKPNICIECDRLIPDTSERLYKYLRVFER